MPQPSAPAVSYHISPPLNNEQLNILFAAAWPHHARRDFAPVLAHSLACICAFQEETLVGFVNLAWDGGIHAFLLDTTVHPARQRQGIGRHLVTHAVAEARRHGMHWLHVDYEPHLEPFYHACGLTPTLAGLLRL